ncbi:PaaI family thioesterase [Piscinibacter sakaiensis]|uniref:PaaI family thioesterase n=1 Tax=Piscinibacter sakaiensis TaxID=1547922 RepID=UPI003AAAF343
MKFPKVIPFAEALGFELLKFEAGEAEIAITLRPEQLNTWQVAHGGVTMTLLDVVMAHAARAPMPDQPKDDRGVVTIEMKTSFLRPGMKRLIGRGKLLHRTSSMAFCEGSVVDEAGELIAHSTGTFKYLRGLPAGGKLIRRPGASD